MILLNSSFGIARYADGNTRLFSKNRNRNFRHKCGALRDLVLFAQFKKYENTHGGVLILVKLQAEAFTTLLKLTLLHGCVSSF